MSTTVHSPRGSAGSDTTHTGTSPWIKPYDSHASSVSAMFMTAMGETPSGTPVRMSRMG